ncbi:MAG: hypothetical protein GAK34_02117 [Delftia tsuruhatensis]|nr:MAG: hypothetical protein GAK34_02117 [Delftia tsuruhatensis]
MVPRAVVVDVNVEILVVVIAQHGQHEKCHRMLTEVGGHITDLQLLARATVTQRQRPGLPRKWVGKASTPVASYFQSLHGIPSGMGVQVSPHHPLRARAASFDHLVDQFASLLLATQAEKSQGQQHLGLVFLGVQLYGSLQRTDGRLPVAHSRIGKPYEQPEFGIAHISCHTLHQGRQCLHKLMVVDQLVDLREIEKLVRRLLRFLAGKNGGHR